MNTLKLHLYCKCMHAKWAFAQTKNIKDCTNSRGFGITQFDSPHSNI